MSSGTIAGATSYAVTGLTASTEYSFRVCAIDAESNLSAGGTVSATTQSASIFATNNIYPGNFGGMYYADFACQLEAQNAGLSGTWLAIISSSTLSAKNRIVVGQPFYNTASTPQLVTISNSLWSGGLTNTINYTATGATVGLASPTWTGSQSDGSYGSGNTCSDWTSTSGNGDTGNTNSTSSYWVDTYGPAACTGYNLFYCINQQTSSAAPSEVSGLSGQATGGGVYLSWASGGGTTAAYQIAYQSGNTAPSNCHSGTVISAYSMFVNSPYYQVTGLTGGQNYSFRVCAANSDLTSFSTGATTTVTVPTTLTTETSPSIFVTANAYKANFGGIYFADFACQLEANNASLGGTWLAIISDSTHNARDRIKVNKAFYNTCPSGSGGPQLVTITSTLWQGYITNMINYTAGGVTNTSSPVWTGTNWDGTYDSGNTCSDWTSNSGHGETGDSGHTNNYWLAAYGPSSCTGSNTMGFFCINQQPSSAAPAEVATFTNGTVTTTTVPLNFTSGGGTTAAYKIAYQTGASAPASCSAGTIISPYTIGVHKTSYSVTGLTTGTQYSFRICAANSDLSSFSTGLTLTATTN